jgi:hypothetical protein
VQHRYSGVFGVNLHHGDKRHQRSDHISIYKRKLLPDVRFFDSKQ